MLISIREQTTENFPEETMVKSITTPRKLSRDPGCALAPYPGQRRHFDTSAEGLSVTIHLEPRCEILKLS
jgi:hypothetical protein